MNNYLADLLSAFIDVSPNFAHTSGSTINKFNKLIHENERHNTKVLKIHSAF